VFCVRHWVRGIHTYIQCAPETGNGHTIDERKAHNHRIVPTKKARAQKVLDENENSNRPTNFAMQAPCWSMQVLRLVLHATYLSSSDRRRLPGKLGGPVNVPALMQRLLVLDKHPLSVQSKTYFSWLRFWRSWRCRQSLFLLPQSQP
jgi:hypothetical protein